MLTERFEDLFRSLVRAFTRYHDAPRTPDQVTELAAARAHLDDVRNEVAAERDLMLRRGPRAKHVRRTSVTEDELARIRVQSQICN